MSGTAANKAAGDTRRIGPWAKPRGEKIGIGRVVASSTVAGVPKG